MIMTGSIAVESDGQKPLDGFRFSTRPRFLIKLQTEPQDLKSGDWLVRDHERLRCFFPPCILPSPLPHFPLPIIPHPSPTQHKHPRIVNNAPPHPPILTLPFSPSLSPLLLLSSLITKSKKMLYKLSRSSFLMCGMDVARLCGGGVELDCTVSIRVGV
jgi:hypothetical protein